MPPPRRLIAFGLLLACTTWIGCGGNTARTSRTPTAAQSGGALTTAAFFSEPLLSHVVLSPDGQKIAAVSAREGVSTLIARPTWGGEIVPLAKVSDPGMSLSDVGWVSDDVILVVFEMPLPAKGHRARKSRLIVVDVERARTRDLGEQWPDELLPLSQNRVIDWLPGDPKHVLIHYRETGKSGTSAVRVDVTNGSLETTVPAERSVHHWYADPEGNVRVGEGIHGGSRTVVARIAPDETFQELVEYDPLAGEGFAFAGYGPEPRALYVYAPTANDRIGLFQYDIQDRVLGTRVFADPAYDVGALVRSPSGRLLGVELVGDTPGIHFVDDAAAREQAAIDRAFPGTTSRIVSIDRAEHTAIVAVSGDRKPPEYYVLDRSKKQMDFLFSAYPLLKGKSLAPMKAVRYTARDGLEIQGYLTLPSEPQTRLPAIVMPHGGPTGRDVWGWNATVQYLVSRGFAVLQPNYRGSSGFGREYARKGVGQWGRAMQDDISDGVAWLVSQGIADPDRVGIYGVGFGGYVALEALATDPELFRAGASLGGITDLADWLEDHESDESSAADKATIGKAANDRDQLKAISPVHQANRIRAPVLIAHGTGDLVVDVEQGHAMADALKDADVPVETYFYRDELHTFIDERNRIDFHEKLAAFFQRHLTPPQKQGARRLTTPPD
jgi:dipeptidyl aminopeptidase/acylaminoacyl peptidase